MEIGYICVPWDVDSVLKMVREVDATEAPVLMGMADSPTLFEEAYVMQHVALENTQHVKVGPFVTNPVTRHWSVQAGAHRTLENMHGPRTFFALAAGDSAVHSVGLRPATAKQMADHARAVREHGPEGLRILIAAGGPKVAAHTGRAADDIVLGQGVDVVASRNMMDSALEARRAEGITEPLKSWLYIFVHLSDPDEPVEQQEHDVFKSLVISQGRQALSSHPEGKNIPEEMRPRLKELFSSYSFERYKDGSNGRLLRNYAEEDEFITNRFSASGTPKEVAETLRAAVASTNADGVWLNLVTPKSAARIRELTEELLASSQHQTVGDRARAG